MTDIQVFATDGFRYLEFIPPIPEEEIVDMPKPTSPTLDREFECEPTSIRKRKVTGHVVDIGWFSESFNGSNEKFMSYAEQVAKHIGGRVLNPDHFVRN